MGDKETTLQTTAACPGEAGTDTNLTFIQNKVGKLSVNSHSTVTEVFYPRGACRYAASQSRRPALFGNYLEPDSRSPPGGQAFED